jgi:nucleoid-associated protein YgaU
MQLNIPVYCLTSRCPLLSVYGNLEFSTRVPFAQQARSDDTFYVTQAKDRLTILAFRFYADVRLWWVLYDVNASLLMGHPLDLPVGITLRIPSQQAVETELLNVSGV